MAVLATIVSILALVLSFASWKTSKKRRSSTDILNSVVNGINKAVDIIASNPMLRVNWIAAGRLLSYCNKLALSITDEQDKQALEIETMILRERAYPFLEFDAPRYYGVMLNNLDDAAQRAAQNGGTIQEQDILALWETIKYPTNVNAHYNGTQFSPEQLRKLPPQLRSYIQHRNR